MAKYILESRRTGTKITGSFENLKSKLSDLTEKDRSVNIRKWEQIQLLTPERLPFRVGKFSLREENEQGNNDGD